MGDVVRLKPMMYVHIHDNNSNITAIVTGPKTLTLESHQKLMFSEPRPFVVVGPAQYGVIENPVLRDKDGNLVKDRHGQAKTQLGEREIRFFQEPFPLFPGEKLINVRELRILTSNEALVLRASRDFTAEDGTKRHAGDEFLFKGPATYYPRVEEELVEKREATLIKHNEALRLRAKNKFKDVNGVQRAVGEEYLYDKTGSYMISVDETLVSVVTAEVLTDRVALHVRCEKAFRDERPWANVDRNPGEVYLVTNEQTAEFIPQPTEKILQRVNVLTVNNKQWAVILDPVVDGKNRLGTRKVITNTNVFLKPGERLHGDGVRPLYVLSEEEALLLTATEEFSDDTESPPIQRVSGEQWLLRGPREYIPSSCVRIVQDPKTGSEKRQRYVLSEGDGIYVRDTYSGEVRAVTNCTYMLAAHEELWEKPLPAIVEEKLARQGDSHASYMSKSTGGRKSRDRTRVVRFAIPHNAVTQVYDYKKRTQRIMYGPDSVALGPEEEFTVLSLSGSEWDPSRPTICLPKKPDLIKSLYLFLGPSSLSDVVNVETSDHARLSLQLSYDWYFDVPHGDEELGAEAFKVPDFVGDCCSCIASRVRASIASVPFKKFHTHSASIVRGAVFGFEKGSDKPKSRLEFPANRLVVTAVDIQEIEVIDKKTKDALAQSVKMAIEITTQSAEASARQEATVREQQARGRLERQQIEDKSAAEVTRKNLLELETTSAAIASTGRAKAEARARAHAAEIEGDTGVQVARTKAQSSTSMDKLQIELQNKRNAMNVDYQADRDSEDVRYQKEMADIESGKFKQTMDAVGSETVTEMAKAGPELQAKLLKGLGLEGYLVTDGTNPINLFNTAKGMTAPPGHADPAAQ